jgi:hypothetical protein
VLHQSCPLNKSFSRRIISLNGYFLLELNSKIIEQAYLCNTNGIFENLTEKIWLKDLLNTFELILHPENECCIKEFKLCKYGIILGLVYGV